MALPAYHEIAAKLGIPHCRGIKPNGQRCYDPGSHQTGFVDASYVHWLDRTRPERAGIRRFLLLEARRRVTVDSGEAGEVIGRADKWRLVYRSLRLLPSLASDLGIRIPVDLGKTDRIKLKAMLVNVNPKDQERIEALAWLK